MRRSLTYLLVLMLVVACKPTVPSEYIQPDDMEDILYDYHLALAMSRQKGGTEMDFNRSLYFQSVLKKHGVTEADFDSVISVNLKGTFNMIKHTYTHFMKKRSGRIVNVSSIVGIQGNAGQANYSASKAGVIGITKSVARELAGRGVTVNAVAPGYIMTDMTNALSDKVKEQFTSAIPMKRGGLPEDVANAIAFLCSDESAYITGEVIRVDGGLAM